MAADRAIPQDTLVTGFAHRQPEFDRRSFHLACGRQNYIAAGFHRVFRIPLPVLITSNAPHSLVTLPLTLYTVSILTSSLYYQIKNIFIISRYTVTIDGVSDW
jgi:hypothetical protein